MVVRHIRWRCVGIGGLVRVCTFVDRFGWMGAAPEGVRSPACRRCRGAKLQNRANPGIAPAARFVMHIRRLKIHERCLLGILTCR